MEQSFDSDSKTVKFLDQLYFHICKEKPYSHIDCTIVIFTVPAISEMQLLRMLYVQKVK